MSPRWRRLLLVAIAVGWFWLALDAASVDALLAAVGPWTGVLTIGAGALAAAAAVSFLVGARHAASPRAWRLGAAAIVLATGAAITVEIVRPVAVAALSVVLSIVVLRWILTLRLLPRFAVLLLVALTAASTLTPPYGPVVLCVGLFLIPGRVEDYLREIVPRRVGSAP